MDMNQGRRPEPGPVQMDAQELRDWKHERGLLSPDGDDAETPIMVDVRPLLKQMERENQNAPHRRYLFTREIMECLREGGYRPC